MLGVSPMNSPQEIKIVPSVPTWVPSTAVSRRTRAAYPRTPTPACASHKCAIRARALRRTVSPACEHMHAPTSRGLPAPPDAGRRLDTRWPGRRHPGRRHHDTNSAWVSQRSISTYTHVGGFGTKTVRRSLRGGHFSGGRPQLTQG